MKAVVEVQMKVEHLSTAATQEVSADQEAEETWVQEEGGCWGGGGAGAGAGGAGAGGAGDAGGVGGAGAEGAFCTN